MNIVYFLNSYVLELPKTRMESDFRLYSSRVLDAYVTELAHVQAVELMSVAIQMLLLTSAA